MRGLNLTKKVLGRGRADRQPPRSGIVFTLLGLMVLGCAVPPGRVQAAPPPMKPARFMMDYYQIGATYSWFKAREPYFYHMYYNRLDGQELRNNLNLQHLDEYSTVFISPMIGTAWPPTPEGKADAVARLEAFARKGGAVVIIGRTPYWLNHPDLLKLLGVKALVPGNDSKKVACEVAAAGHPLFAGCGKPGTALAIEASPVLVGPCDGTVLLREKGSENRIAALERTVGEGRVIFLPQELFPPFAANTREVAQKDLPPFIGRFLQNLLGYVRVPALSDAIQSRMALGPFAGSKLVVWYRPADHVVFQGAQMLQSPAPMEQGEAVTEIRRVVGINEHERIPLYVTVQGAAEPVRIRLTQKSPQTPDLISGADLRVQGAPASDVAGPTVYLDALPVLGEERELAVAPADTKTLWLRLNTQGAAPGAYEGEILFSCGEAQQRVALVLDVRAVALPEYHLHHFEVETNALASQTGIDPKKIAAALDDLAAAHADHIMVSPAMYDDIPLRPNGPRLTQFMTPANRERFEKGDLPRLDFTASSDVYFHEAIRRGMVIHRAYQTYNAERYLGNLRTMYGKPDLTTKSPEFEKFAHWYLVQQLNYIREKGYRFAYLKWGDEWGAKEIDAAVEAIRPLHETGWGVAINPNGVQVVGVPEYFARLKPLVDIWQETAGPEFYVRAVAGLQKEREVIPPDGLWMITTSSFWWNQPMWSGLQHGYTMAFNGLRSFHFHGWTRGGIHGVYLDNRNGRFIVRPSLGYQMIGEGIEESEFLTLAKRLVRYGRQEGRDMDRFEARLNAIVGPGAQWVPLVQFPTGEQYAVPKEAKATNLISYFPHPSARQPMADYYRAKVALLDVIADLQREIGPIHKELRWGYFRVHKPKDGPMLLGGNAGTAGAREKLRAALEAKAGESLPMRDAPNLSDVPEHGGVALLVFNAQDKALKGRLLARYPTLDMDDSYPHVHSYAIYGPMPNGKGQVILIVGGSADGARLGCENFVRFIEDAFGGEAPLRVQ